MGACIRPSQSKRKNEIKTFNLPRINFSNKNRNIKPLLKPRATDSGKESLNIFLDEHKEDNPNKFLPQNHSGKLKTKYQNSLRTQEGYKNKCEIPISRNMKIDIQVGRRQAPDNGLNEKIAAKRDREENKIEKNMIFNAGISGKESLRAQEGYKNKFENPISQSLKTGIQVERRQAEDTCLNEKIPAKRDREENRIEKDKNSDVGKLKLKCNNLISKEDKKSNRRNIKASLKEIPKKEEPIFESEDIKSIRSKYIGNFNRDLPSEKSTPKPLSIDTKDKPKPVGLKNLGNTCYMNSIIQCIAYLPSFDTQLTNSNTEISIRLLRLITSLKNKDPNQLDLIQFKNTVNKECSILNNSQPNDSKIFFSQLITLLSPETHSIEKRFLIKIKYNFYCTTCQSSSSTTHKELHIQIISDSPFFQEQISQKLKRIIDIGYESFFYCKRCCKLTSPENIIDVKCCLPETLLIYLGESQKRESFAFPLNLNLNDTKKDIRYSLRSVYNGLYGHATSVIKFNKKWYNMNDENVTSVGVPYSKYAVLLFYQKKS